MITAGSRYNRLVAIAPAVIGRGVRWRFQCDCGTIWVGSSNRVASGAVTSCGCRRTAGIGVAVPTHGDTGTRLHRIWKGMRRRCETPTSSGYDQYGARGIFVCDAWKEYVAFAAWSQANGYLPTRQIDRIDSSGPYNPENCRWVAAKINASRNKLGSDGAYLKHLTGMLTEQVVKEATVRTSSYRLPDGAGLYLWVSRAGAKVWRYRYRFKDSEKLLVIGKTSEITLSEARELHAIARKALLEGSDPAQIKQASASRRRRASNGWPAKGG
ncbi:Arm DNA-binding domain-containing protein [Sphingomonas sp. UYP23]